jgi:hypothetical protein
MDVGTHHASMEIRNYSKLMEGTASGPSKIIGRDRLVPPSKNFSRGNS